MRLERHIPAIALAIEKGATRPGQVPGVPPMHTGRILAHPKLRSQLESMLYAEVVLFTDGSFAVRGWFDTEHLHLPGKSPALLGGLGGAAHTPREQDDAENKARQRSWL